MDEKLKILLCEDDENLGMLLREYLAAKGYTAELCPDGEAGYKAFLKTKFDICVLDVMMPKNRTLGPPLENNPEIPPSSRDEGLRLLHGLATNLATSLQTPQEA